MPPEGPLSVVRALPPEGLLSAALFMFCAAPPVGHLSAVRAVPPGGPLSAALYLICAVPPVGSLSAVRAVPPEGPLSAALFMFLRGATRRASLRGASGATRRASLRCTIYVLRGATRRAPLRLAVPPGGPLFADNSLPSFRTSRCHPKGLSPLPNICVRGAPTTGPFSAALFFM